MWDVGASTVARLIIKLIARGVGACAAVAVSAVPYSRVYMYERQPFRRIFYFRFSRVYVSNIDAACCNALLFL